MNPIYVNHHHQIIIETYLRAVFDSINEIIDDPSKIADFKDISDIIIEYHNDYSDVKKTGNFHDFLMIIPINFSIMINGFLCGYENKSNATVIRIHRTLLQNFGLKVIDDLKTIKIIND
tara:strand:- start:1032 stop:1388 length:357 start_codon:yes stop_codon:yes gene_type:complete